MTFFASFLLMCSASLALAAARLPVESASAASAAFPFPVFQTQSDDAALASVRSMDRTDRAPDGSLAQLSSAEHLRRANIYMNNRAFDEARAHWQAIVDRYPNDPNVPAALFGMGRSYFQVRRYEESVPLFERLVSDFAQWKEGREGLYSLASALLRAGRAAEAAARYREYTERYPQGERIEAAYLNTIDTLREAGQPQEAITWIARTRARFPGTATDTNALFARLRLDIAGSDWPHAVQTSDELRRASFQSGVMTNATEVAYLRAYSLERGGRKAEAINAYLAIPDDADSYHGGLATTRLLALVDAARRPLVTARVNRAQADIEADAGLYPAPYREAIVREASKRKVDPRLVLAIMRHESGFRPRAKSPAAARGLLQLTIDTATKYAPRSGINNLRDDDLYRPETNISIASEYLAELMRLFPGLPEAVAASYNGGEDNVARWVKRAVHADAGVFASEVGFSETKSYVTKVMSSYRAYRQLYTDDLRQK